ncbi:hypothetical protein [Salipiger mucosus]|uniref:Uncharacterized protein n=1 Tax=Salipiger mucosus DSM 16094 TaxID=1123237 RepID=S9R0I7_9RHOB|nr:hypothetical protein [Salipiger mucosus]EPX85397.1 hypothetical protein Salmuc_02778 [Salipiger mucosus DSM 16094]
MLAGLEARLRAGLSRAARNLLGGLCLIVAAVFLSMAAWMAIEPVHGTMAAALSLGGGYLVMGLLFIFIPVRARLPAVPVSNGSSAASLIDAFLAGRAAGRAMHRED